MNAFANQMLQSQLVFLLEPHVLKHIGKYKPDQIFKLTRQYLTLEQGSREFLDQMITFSASMAADATTHNAVGLLKMLQQKYAHTSAVKLIIDHNLLKSIEKIKEKDIYGLVRTVEAHGINKPILFDLLAT